ncbi:MAG TPA: T9SS type A sorting domain-containing protein, partial [Ignavibacteriales bacterium]|nr:T9SS type A sorting domain-containing protein [Ignavibacteriales bacterium]
RLIEIRKEFPALISENYEEIPAVPGASLFAYRRWEGGENIFTVLNMKSAAQTAAITLPIDKLNLAVDKTYYLTELISGEAISGTGETLAQLNIEMPAYSAKIFALADTTINVIGIEDEVIAENNIPEKFDLKQNYPNPFNPSTTIKFDLPEDGAVTLKIFNVLGEEVAQLINGGMRRGTHTVMFNAGSLSSGVYLYRLEHNGLTQMKKMILIK